MIWEQRIYNDHNGVTIQSKTEIADDGIPREPEFFALGIIPYQTPREAGQYQFYVLVPGRTPAEAFANFAAAFEPARQKAEQELRAKLAAAEKKIVIPGQSIPAELNGRALRR